MKPYSPSFRHAVTTSARLPSRPVRSDQFSSVTPEPSEGQDAGCLLVLTFVVLDPDDEALAGSMGKANQGQQRRAALHRARLDPTDIGLRNSDRKSTRLKSS